MTRIGRLVQALTIGATLSIVIPAGAQAATIKVAAGGSISAAVAKAKPGDTVLLAPGLYPATKITRREGAVSKPIRIVGAERGSVVIQGLDLEYAEGLHLSELTVISGGLQINGSQHIAVSDTTVTPSTSPTGAIAQGITIARSGVHVSSDIALSDLIVNGQLQSQTAASAALPAGTVNPSTGSSEGHALVIGSGLPNAAALPQSAWVHDITITNSDLSFTHDSVVFLDEAKNVSFTLDKIHDMGDNAGGNSDIFALAASTVSITKTDIYATKAYSALGTSANQGLLIGGSGQRSGDVVENVSLVDDLIHALPGVGVVVDGVTNLGIVNDSIVNNRTPGATADAAAISVGQSSSLHVNSGISVINDILTRVFVQTAVAAPAVATNNLVEVSNPGVDGQNAVTTSDPGFADQTSLLLLPTSSAINHGITRAFVPTDDFSGVVRDATPDIGAREYSVTPIAGTLVPPTGVSAAAVAVEGKIHPYFRMSWKFGSTRPQYFVINIARTPTFSGRQAYREPGTVSSAGIRCTPSKTPYYVRVRSLTYGLGRSAFSVTAKVTCVA